MNYNPKVVSFSRSAAYVHHRAMKNRRDNNPVDALELMRHAVERSPENDEYKLDLAEMYCEMGLHDQSNRILLDMLARENAPSECYYGLALNQLGSNNPEAARRALRLYQKRAQDGAYAEEATNITAELDFFQEINRSHDRKGNRAAQIASNACDALQKSDFEKAVRLFERSLSMNPAQNEMRALYALSLRLTGEVERAIEEAEKSVQDDDDDVRTLSVAAQIFWMCDDGIRARQLIQRAIDTHPSGLELRLLVFALGEMNMAREAADALKLALQETPYDKLLLHMRAVALHRIGAPDHVVESFWLRILRMDPNDTVAAYYQEMAAQGKLNDIDPEYVYEVPDAEFKRRVLVIADQLSHGLPSAVERWREDRAFRALLYWAVCTGIQSCSYAAVMIIASAGDEESASMLRELFYRNDIPISVKEHAMLFLYMRGENGEDLLPPDANADDGLLPEADEMLAEMPAVERQLVRYADEVLSGEYDVHALSGLTALWGMYRKLAGKISDPLVSTQEAAAALAWNYMLQHGHPVKVNRLARQFGCKKRRMVYYALRIATVMDVKKGADKDEDH